MAAVAASIFLSPGPSAAQPAQPAEPAASAAPGQSANPTAGEAAAPSIPRGQLSDFDRKTYITSPAWAATPSVDEIVAAYKAHSDGKRGSVVMDCPVLENGTFGECRLVTEIPPDQGMAQAALSLMPKFQMKTKDGGGKPVAGRTMRMSLAFAPVS